MTIISCLRKIPQKTLLRSFLTTETKTAREWLFYYLNEGRGNFDSDGNGWNPLKNKSGWCIYHKTAGTLLTEAL